MSSSTSRSMEIVLSNTKELRLERVILRKWNRGKRIDGYWKPIGV